MDKNNNAAVSLIVIGLIGVFISPIIVDKAWLIIAMIIFLIPNIIGVFLILKNKQAYKLKKAQQISLLVTFLILVIYLMPRFL